MDIAQVGRPLVVLGVVLIGLGLALTFAGGIPLVGRLPGDIRLGGDRWTVYIPLGTSILLSMVLNLVPGAASLLGGRRSER